MNKLVYIGIGTNLGDRQHNIDRALLMMSNKGIIPKKQSSVENTKAVDYLDQPDFLNTIVLCETELSPQPLLEKLLEIELIMGRERSINKGPRVIDLDILLYEDQIVSTTDLTIPHPGIVDRPFILKHLIELNLDLIDPKSGTLYREVYNEEK